MRLVYLSQVPIPSTAANSVQVMKMCEAFAEAGHDVTLITPEFPDGKSSSADPYAPYGVARTFGIRRIPWRRMKGAAYVYGLSAALVARRMKADLAFGRGLQACYFAAVLGIPVIFETHKPQVRAGRLSSWIHSRLVGHPSFKHLVVISDALRNEYARRSAIPASRIVVARDGADSPKLGFGAQEDLEESVAAEHELTVGYVGHLYPGKGVEVISYLARACPWASFHVVGGNQAEIERWGRKLSGTENVRFHGFVPHAEVKRLHAMCDVLLAPYQRRVASVSGQDIAPWMSPLKIFEYMASGRAILASDLPVLREFLEHRVNAWLCSPDSPEQWKMALEYLRDHPEIRRALGDRARLELESKYTWAARARTVLAPASDD